MAVHISLPKWSWAAAGVLVVSLLALGWVLVEAHASSSVPPTPVVYDQPLTANYTPGADESDLADGGSLSTGNLALPNLFHPGYTQPHAVLSGDFFDFGKINPGAVVRRSFYLTNQGRTPLVIRQAYTTCPCASATLSATVIPPGKSSQITVTFNAGVTPLSGLTVRRGLIIDTNDPSRPELAIWVQAAVGK